MKKSLYEFTSYKDYFNYWVSQLPKEGHGEYRRLSQHLKISTTMVSQVFKGEKHLSLEMACDLCDYLGFNEEESEYFLLLAEYQKAGSYKLESRLLKQIKKRQEKANKIENRVKKDAELSEQDKAVFYSSWIHSGVRLLTDLPEYSDASSIAKRLAIPMNTVQRVLDFLLDKNLCIKKNGQYQMGPAITYSSASSLLTIKHHQNWRLHGFNKMIYQDEKNVFFTSPMTLSNELADEIRARIPEFIQGIAKQIGPSKSEVVRCLNIDWFEY
jgi:uncharacterized protein (TIGR02147 family)